MTDRLIDMLLQLAPRERVLLGALFVVVLPLALVLGLLWPLAEQRTAAQVELAEARALDAWVLARQSDLNGLARPATDAQVFAPISTSAVEQSLIDRRLRDALSRLETRDSGEITLDFAEVRFTDLMAWLDASDPGWGYQIAVLRLLDIETPSLVSAQLTLVPTNQP